VSAAAFDELIHAPTRLSLVAFLAATGWTDFAVLRDNVGLSDSALSKQLTTLAGAGYIEIRKTFVGKRPRTSARLTPRGHNAFDRHVLALQDIVASAGKSITPTRAASKPSQPVSPRRRRPGRSSAAPAPR
jgi:DNA-binding HxlR family transcriptional regulator